MTQKTLLIVGGVALGGIVLYFLYERSKQQQIASLNQPGLVGSASTGVGSIIDGISSLTNGLSNLVAGAFSDTGALNQPGLDSSEPTDFPGYTYTPENSTNYGFGVTSGAPTDGLISDLQYEYA